MIYFLWNLNLLFLYWCKALYQDKKQHQFHMEKSRWQRHWETLLLHSLKTCFNSVRGMFYLANSKSRTQCCMILKFSSCESNELLSKMVSKSFLLLSWIIKRSLKKETNTNTLTNLTNTSWSHFSVNRKKANKPQNSSVEIFDKIMNLLKNAELRKPARLLLVIQLHIYCWKRAVWNRFLRNQTSLCWSLIY